MISASMVTSTREAAIGIADYAATSAILLLIWSLWIFNAVGSQTTELIYDVI